MLQRSANILIDPQTIAHLQSRLTGKPSWCTGELSPRMAYLDCEPVPTRSLANTPNCWHVLHGIDEWDKPTSNPSTPLGAITT